MPWYLYRVLIGILCLYLLIGLGLAQEIINEPLIVQQTSRSIKVIEWNPTGTLLLEGSYDGLRLLNENLEEIFVIYQGHTINSVSWKLDGLEFVITHGHDIEIWNWDATLQQAVLNYRLTSPEEQIYVSWDATGNWIASMGLTRYDASLGLGRIYFWDTLSKTLANTSTNIYTVDLETPTKNILDWYGGDLPLLIGIGGSVKYDTGNLVYDSALIIYVVDARTGQQVTIFPLLSFKAFSVAWQAQTDVIAVGTELGSDVYQYPSGEFIRSYPFGTDIEALEWSFDGAYLLADNLIIDYANDRLLGGFATSASVQAAVWNPKTSIIAIASQDGVLQLENPFAFEGFDPDS